jgi:UDP-N-acetylmuramoylalanine--D-glutamate ligase
VLKVSGYEGKNIGVFGLAKTGLATLRALIAGGARVFAFDDDAAKCTAAESLGAEIRDFRSADLSSLKALLVSPGIPLTHPAPHPVVIRAKAAGVTVIGDIELFAETLKSLPKAAVVAITGTNGKSTTTALIGHVLETCGRPVAVGGNLGLPVLEFEPLPQGGIYVIEMSSYQIDLTHSLAPDVAVLLNITPDHLDRHGGMAGYIAAKKRLFAAQRPGQAAVVGIDDAPSRDVLAELQAREGGPKVIPISSLDPALGGVSVIDGTLYDALSGAAVPIGRLDNAPGLVGRHNWQNAAAAYAAARSLGLGPSEIFSALMSFPGLAHRMELVAEYHGVKFVNDSKATNVDAASRALGSYKNIFWIAGGKPKTTDLSDLAPYFSRIAKAFLIGEAAEAFAASLEGKVEVVQCGTLTRAVDAAALAALDSTKGPAVVLLSPACASFDQFPNFEERGHRFMEAAKAFINMREAHEKAGHQNAGSNGK